MNQTYYSVKNQSSFVSLSKCTEILIAKQDDTRPSGRELAVRLHGGLEEREVCWFRQYLFYH